MKFSLTIKITIVVAEVLLITVGISAYFGIRIQENYLITQAKQEGQKFSQTIHHQLEHAMLSGRREDVQSFLVDLGNSEQITEASVFNPETGEIIYSSNFARVNKKINANYQRIVETDEINSLVETRYPSRILTVLGPITNRAWCQECHHLDAVQSLTENHARIKVLAIFTPIQNKPECQRCHVTRNPVLGVLYFRPSLDLILEQIAHTKQLFIYSAVFTVIIALAVITIFMRRLVRRPIAQLEQSMAAVANGNLSTRATIHAEDELGRLSRHFNLMVAQLETANKQLEAAHEAELLRAGKLASLGELAAGLAHELKNPLSGISAATQVLYDQFPESDPRREIMLEMNTQVTRLNKTLNDLLSFAKPKPPQLTPVTVHDIVHNVILLIQAQAAQHQVEIQENYTADLPPVNLDAEQFKQVLLNLMLNAFQAMEHGGTLTVGTKLAGKYTLAITIQDTGKGIAPENLENIFAPFFTTRAKGTGLGLTVSKKIVELHNGEISVQSEFGKGTVFTIYLPIVEIGSNL